MRCSNQRKYFGWYKQLDSDKKADCISRCSTSHVVSVNKTFMPPKNCLLSTINIGKVHDQAVPSPRLIGMPCWSHHIKHQQQQQIQQTKQSHWSYRPPHEIDLLPRYRQIQDPYRALKHSLNIQYLGYCLEITKGREGHASILTEIEDLFCI